MDELRTMSAAQLLEEFRKGELSLDGGEVGVDNRGLREAAEHDLACLKERFGEDAYSELCDMHPRWAHERVRLICDCADKPLLSEIRQHMAVMFKTDDEGRFLIMVEKWPLKQDNRVIGWAVIRENGISLDRDYEVAYICGTEEGASEFISNYFRFSD